MAPGSGRPLVTPAPLGSSCPSSLAPRWADGGRRTALAAGAGLIVSLAALGSFYVVNTWALALGPHPWVVDLRLALEGGRTYIALGVLSGPTFGALGGWWQGHRSTLIGVLVAALLVFEPLAWLAYERARPDRLTNYPVVWVVEVIVGLAACVFVTTVTRARRRS
jgi:hypothetical protein